MGNFARHVPAIHPMVAIARWDVTPHTPEFARAARTSAASKAVLDGAKALAMTTVDLWLDPALAARVRTQNQLRTGGRPPHLKSPFGNAQALGRGA
jgi:hypothetical protein